MKKFLIATILIIGVFGDTSSFTSCSYLSCLATGSYKQSFTSRQTTKCLEGYYWAGQSCQPCRPIDGGHYECTTYWGTGTLVCDSGYTQLNNICVQMPNGCTQYSLNQQQNAYVCGKCDTGFTLIAGVCVNNQQCAVFSSTRYLCTQCNPGYYLNWDLTPSASTATTTYFNSFDSFCSPCSISGCIDCQSRNTCKTCQAGTFWSFSGITSGTTLTGSGTCQNCLDFCINCTNALMCTQCADGYYVSTVGTTTTCAQCLPSPNCIKCTNGTSCSLCATGYQLIGSTTCAQLTLGCTAMDQNLNCTTCATYYALNTQSPKACTSCGTGCQTCTWNGTSVNCSQCFDLYYAVKGSDGVVSCSLCSAYPGGTGWLRCQGPNDSPSSTTIQATQCVDGYFLVSVTTGGVSIATCVSAVPSQACLTITNTSTNTNNICATCVPDYGQYQNGTCLSCPPQQGAKTQLSSQCNKCTGSASTDISCSGCSSGFFLQQATSATQATCAQCSTGCTSCQSSTNCTQCSTGYYTSGATGSQICSSCQQNCATCDSSTVCKTCVDGFFLYSGNKTAQAVCVACQVGCATCIAPGNVCATCNSGYVLSSGGCIPLNQANCADKLNSTYVDTGDKPTTSSGCGICRYGFYMLSNKCFESVQPYAGFAYGLATNATNTTDTPVNGQVLFVTILALILAQ